MRLGIFTIVLTLGLVPANTWAQGYDPPPYFSIPAIGRAIVPLAPLPQIGLPLPQIGLPLPQIGLPPPVVPRPPDVPIHASRRPWGGRFAPWPYMVLVVPAFVPMVVPQVIPEPPLPVTAAKGSLVLAVQPASAEVFVDGYYIGSAEEFAGERGGGFLEAGPHRIELRAAGYESVSFDVKIAPNEAVAYRRELIAVGKTAPAALPVANTPTTIYMIPGCYVGNVAPTDAGLPKTCDVTRALIVQM